MKKPYAWIIAIGIVLLLPLAFFFYFDVHKLKPLKHLTNFGEVPFFKLVNQNGDTITSDDLKGYIYVADFFFTSCPGMCPKLTTQLTKVQEGYKSEPRIKIVSYTVDPMHDSIPVLKKYAEKYKADINKWYFLTGDKNYIWNLAEKGYKVPVVEDAGGVEAFTHSNRLVVVDASGKIRGYYNATDPAKVDSMFNDIERLLIEKPI